jgi:hypothetical protein
VALPDINSKEYRWWWITETKLDQINDLSASPRECWITDVHHHILLHSFFFVVLGFEIRNYIWTTPPTLFWMGVWVSQTICTGWLWTMILLISASWVARITGWVFRTGLCFILVPVVCVFCLPVLLEVCQFHCSFQRTSCLVHLSSLFLISVIFAIYYVLSCACIWFFYFVFVDFLFETFLV